MTHDEAVKTIKEALYDGHPCMIENLFLDALSALDSLDVKPIEIESVATKLAESIKNRFYNGNDSWRPLAGDVVGILTQIDNMVAGLTKAVVSSEDVEELCHQIYDVLPVSPSLKLLDDGRLYALITARDERISRECADKAIAWAEYYSGDDWQPVTKDSFREAIMGEAKK